MMRRLLLALLLIAPLTTASAQLPLMTAPSGTLRIELGGGFFPSDRLRVDGKNLVLGDRLTTSALNAAATPMVGDLESRLATLLARPVSGYSLGALSAIAEQQRGVATLGLGLGLSRRVTLSARVPIVSVRTQLQLRSDATGANLGLNPADPSLGNSTGIGQTATFFTAFDAALVALTTRIAADAFTPTQRALAERTLADGTALRNGLFRLLADPTHSTPVLPTATSADGMALLGMITTLDATLGTALNGARINAAPALPTLPLTATALNALIRAPTGFAIGPPEDLPLVGLGDVEIGITVELLRRADVGADRWMRAWAHGGARLSTGRLARPTLLLDQGSGDGQPDIELGGTVELGRGPIGIRATGLLTFQLAGTALERLGGRDQLLRPARSTSLLTRNAGDLVTVTAEPFIRIAPHFAMTGMLQYQRRGADALAYADPSDASASIDLSAFVTGTGANTTRIAIGLSYVHDGLNREGILKMPVEAGVSIERTLGSSAGVVASPLTTRLVFRVYKQVSGR